MVGLFQAFRPDPAPLEAVFEEVPGGDEVFERLEEVYAIAGDPRRPDGMKDAYFIVRRPQVSPADQLREMAEDFFRILGNLAFEQSRDELAERLTPPPSVRVLEGKPPKHPKQEEEKSELMKAVTQVGPRVTESLIAKCEFASFVQRSLYFIACDGFLRDYILWPLVAEHSAVGDPFRSYFEIWKHGAKYRIFGNRQIDLYVPRSFAVGS